MHRKAERHNKATQLKEADVGHFGPAMGFVYLELSNFDGQFGLGPELLDLVSFLNSAEVT